MKTRRWSHWISSNWNQAACYTGSCCPFLIREKIESMNRCRLMVLENIKRSNPSGRFHLQILKVGYSIYPSRWVWQSKKRKRMTTSMMFRLSFSLISHISLLPDDLSLWGWRTLGASAAFDNVRSLHKVINLLNVDFLFLYFLLLSKFLISPLFIIGCIALLFDLLSVIQKRLINFGNAKVFLHGSLGVGTSHQQKELFFRRNWRLLIQRFLRYID